MSNEKPSLSDILACLPELASLHARTTPTYHLLEKAAAQALLGTSLQEAVPTQPEEIGGFGKVTLPFTSMGAINSLHLFGLDELIIFAFYYANRNRYKRAADIGANIGLHSILMDRCGWTVHSYEPDPTHASLLRKHLALNNCTRVTLHEEAVSDKAGTCEFVRVLGNTTSSHLAGSKSNAYGELERFSVKVTPFLEIADNADFIKVDAEGQEKAIILSTQASHWQNLDMMVEIGTPANAEAVYPHLRKLGVNAFAQKKGWARVECLEDMPTTYKEGSLFITRKPAMPWL